MKNSMDGIARRTTTDAVYEQLHDEIVSLKIRPGTKLSETEVARRFGVSRQPVRNAFTRLGEKDLLVIRPQKATEVRGFSMDRIDYARFVRLAVEIEIAHRAIEVWDTARDAKLAENLKLQSDALARDDFAEFHALDYTFHSLICEMSNQASAFDLIRNSKQMVDRLCMLALADESGAKHVLADHQDIARGLASGDIDTATQAIRRHLGRLDATIDAIHESHSDYFE